MSSDEKVPIALPFGLSPGNAICYSGYREGQSPHDGTFPSYAQVHEDLRILDGRPKTRYAVSEETRALYLMAWARWRSGRFCAARW